MYAFGFNILKFVKTFRLNILKASLVMLCLIAISYVKK